MSYSKTSPLTKASGHYTGAQLWGAFASSDAFPVDSPVLFSGDNHQVFGGIVHSVPVDMMNVLIPAKSAPQIRTHNQPMLKDVSARVRHGMFGHPNVDVLIPAHERIPFQMSCPALKRAESRRLANPGRSPECKITGFADVLHLAARRRLRLPLAGTRAVGPAATIYLIIGNSERSLAHQTDALGRMRRSIARLRAVSAGLRLAALRGEHNAASGADFFNAWESLSIEVRHFDLLARSRWRRAGDVSALPGFSLPQLYQVGGAYAD